MRSGTSRSVTPRKLENTVVMETGGMKGYREEIPKEEFHRILCRAFGVGAIHSEYGMAELTSQAYSAGGNRFRCPAWMRVAARDVNDPFCTLPAGARRTEHHGPGEPLVVRLHPDRGRRTCRSRRLVRRRGAYRPRGHPGLQPAGAGITEQPNQRMKTVAFVPIRLNSQRVAGKNLRLLGGEPLMCHILRTLTRTEGIDEVWVYCSDESIRPLLPEGVRFRRRSEEAGPRHHAGPRDLRQLHLRGRCRPLRARARHLALHPRGDRRRGARQGPLGSVRLGLQRRTDPDLRLVRGPAAELLPRRDSPHADDRTDLHRDQRLLHLPARVVARTPPPHRRPTPTWPSWTGSRGMDIDYPEDFTMAEIIAASRTLPR